MTFPGNNTVQGTEHNSNTIPSYVPVLLLTTQGIVNINNRDTLHQKGEALIMKFTRDNILNT